MGGDGALGGESGVSVTALCAGLNRLGFGDLAKDAPSLFDALCHRLRELAAERSETTGEDHRFGFWAVRVAVQELVMATLFSETFLTPTAAREGSAETADDGGDPFDPDALLAKLRR